ncbi:hypothetical protein CC2G_010068 [Coprinopsis cinerea AmutBmut pab1-1]|nr:hypothetical protein CC2G_010068 [Coprinopsis cinerea AmutBmut pab1-1]
MEVEPIPAFLAAQREIDEQIRGLRSRRNALAPVSSLPDEILCHIFQAYIAGARTDSRWHSMTTLTGICRRWRSAALECPELWSTIHSWMGPASLESTIARSKDAPVSVTVSTEGWTTLDPRRHQLIAGVLAQTYRLVNLRLGVNLQLLDGLLRLLDSPAPQLEKLTVEPKGLGEAEAVDLPLSLFGGEAPRLRDLSLVECYPPWTSPILQGLTSLNITFPCIDSPVPPHDKLLATLKNLPRLVNLTLCMNFPDLDQPSSADQVAKLPSLKRLEIASNTGGSAGLLQNIRIPLEASVKLLGYETAEEDFAALRAGLWSAWLSNPLSGSQLTSVGSRASPIRSLWIKEGGAGLSVYAEIQGWSEAVDMSRGSKPPEQGAALSIYTELPDDVMFRSTSISQAIDRHAASALPLEDVRSLRVQAQLDDWAPVLRRLSSVQQLYVGRLGASRAIGALALAAFNSNRADETSPGNTDSPHLPKLETLCLHLELSTSVTSPIEDPIANLIYFAEYRNRKGARIKHLSFSTSTECLNEDLERLGGVVDKVNIVPPWEGLRYGFVLTDDFDDFAEDGPVMPGGLG